MIVSEPSWPDVGVKVTEQVPATRVHVVKLKVPEPEGATVNVTVPVGVELPLPPVSVTVTVHVEAWFTTTEEGEQETAVLVVLFADVRVVDPLLARWSPSPP